jgi:hypothetical protein
MTPEPSAAAIVLPLIRPSDPHAVRGSFAGASRGRAGDGAVLVNRSGREHGFRRLFSALEDLVGLAAVSMAFPLVILAVGIPVALLVRLVMWLVGMG